ncbi:hypothetical protein SDC9_159101 [bioreactor metagenome]|uniref:Uncharacterized protein n=1 Tax=bioreactor metagenome TaxID=1076179 RepID=A0A645FHR7_9ZZZZ
MRAIPADSAVLGQNRNAALTFDGVVVHDGVDNFFVLGKGAGLAQQLVHHGGLAVVNVRDDRNIADLCSHICVRLISSNIQAGGGAPGS